MDRYFGKYFGQVFWAGILGRYFRKVFWEGILGQVFWEGILGMYVELQEVILGKIRFRINATLKTTLNYRSRAETTLNYRSGAPGCHTRSNRLSN